MHKWYNKCMGVDNIPFLKVIVRKIISKMRNWIDGFACLKSWTLHSREILNQWQKGNCE